MPKKSQSGIGLMNKDGLMNLISSLSQAKGLLATLELSHPSLCRQYRMNPSKLPVVYRNAKMQERLRWLRDRPEVWSKGAYNILQMMACSGLYSKRFSVTDSGSTIDRMIRYLKTEKELKNNP